MPDAPTAARTVWPELPPLLAFLQLTYEAAAGHGDWDRAALEHAASRV